MPLLCKLGQHEWEWQYLNQKVLRHAAGLRAVPKDEESRARSSTSGSGLREVMA